MSAFTSTVRTKSDPREGKKYFTVAEARRALPLVKRIAADIQTTQALRLRVHGELSSEISQLTPAQQARLEGDFERTTVRLEGLIEELTKIGVELKDPSRALLDFPAIYEGREVHLCWKAGEETILHWHEVDGGFAGRKLVASMHD